MVVRKYGYHCLNSEILIYVKVIYETTSPGRSSKEWGSRNKTRKKGGPSDGIISGKFPQRARLTQSQSSPAGSVCPT